ncbi:MAG: hypothetical protein M0P71_13215 [Melioribacteraceae bacterium]|jgi:hypothetical protein|nr:hypothetical protein [Melioribacteraceae bacterium]
MKKEIPKEHQLVCPGCGQILDMRDISVLSHGWIEGDSIVCYLDEGEHAIPYSGSQKRGEPILWTKDKEPINLN